MFKTTNLLLIVMSLIFLLTVVVTIKHTGHQQVTQPADEIRKVEKNSVALELRLPDGIYPEQIGPSISTKDAHFLLYLKRNVNFFLSGAAANESGVLIAKTGDENWSRFIVIRDTANTSNNPYWLDVEDGLYSILVIDANGAGSGEGIAKLIVIDPAHSTWSIQQCFYFGAEQDNGLWKQDQNLSLMEAVNKYVVDNKALTYPVVTDEIDITLGSFPSTVSAPLDTNNHCSDFSVVLF